MMNPMQLNDEALDQSLRKLVRAEREILSEILHHLLEVERRRLFSSFGCSSLFDYAIKELGYTENEAGPRISAMRLLKELPQIEEKIESGALTVTHLAKARTVFRKELKANKLRSSDEKLELLLKLENTTKVEAEKTLEREALVPIAPIPAAMRAELSFEQFPEALRTKLQRLLDLYTNVSPGITLTELVDVMADETLKRKDPVLKAARIQLKEAAKPITSNKVNNADQHFPERVAPSRYIPSAVRHSVYMRDRGLCQICNSSRAIEIDHINPFALGGINTVENLRLLCRNCNQRHAIKSYGLKKMSRYLRSPALEYIGCASGL